MFPFYDDRVETFVYDCVKGLLFTTTGNYYWLTYWEFYFCPYAIDANTPVPVFFTWYAHLRTLGADLKLLKLLSFARTFEGIFPDYIPVASKVA